MVLFVSFLCYFFSITLSLGLIELEREVEIQNSTAYRVLLAELLEVNHNITCFS